MKITLFGFTKLLSFSALLLAGSTVQAGITFTVTGIASSTALGYIATNPYTFTFVTGQSFGNNGSSFFGYSSSVNADMNEWREEDVVEDQLFTSTTGPGLTGSFIRPIANSYDPFSFIRTTANGWGVGNDRVDVYAGTNGFTGIGIEANGGASIITEITFTFGIGQNLNYLNNYFEPTTIFDAANGFHSVTGSLGMTDTNVNGVSFSLQSVTIATTPVPEPSTYTAFAGIVAFSFITLRRRK